MRPLEGLLSAANLLAFLSFVLPLTPGMSWIRSIATLGLLIAIIQLVLEGPRWQMIPAYMLAFIFSLIWLFGLILLNGLQPHRFMVGVGIVLAALAILASLLLPIGLPIFHFPKPTGRYSIGTLTYHWVDTQRPELFTIDPHDQRELMAQIWYPAQNEPTAPRAPYIQEAETVAPALGRITGLPQFLFTHFKYVTTHAVDSAPIAEDQAHYPVLVFLSGLGGFRQVNTFQIEELVSQGYIVVGLDQPGAVALTQYPDGRQVFGLPKDQIQSLIEQSVEALPTPPTLFGKAMPEGIIPYFASDVSFALDQLMLLNQSDSNHLLTGHLDLERIGIFGISLGGINAAEACLQDQRLKACLIMDVFMSEHVVKNGLQQPTMWITRDAQTMRLERERAGGWTEKDIESHQRTMRAVYEGLSGDGYYLQIPNMFHLNLTDFPYWSPFWSQLGLTGPIDSQRVFDIVNAYSVSFFNKHIKGETSSLLDGPSPQYPEVNFETRRP